MAHLAHKQDAELNNFCKDLENDAQNARLQMEDWQNQVERLIDDIELEESLLKDLRRQRHRTGDDLFDIDIEQQKDTIKNLKRQVPLAKSNARQWKAQLAIFDRQLIANNCGNFA